MECKEHFLKKKKKQKIERKGRKTSSSRPISQCNREPIFALGLYKKSVMKTRGAHGTLPLTAELGASN